MAFVFSPGKLTPEVCRLCRGAGIVNHETGQKKGQQEVCQRCGGTGRKTLRTK